MSNALHATLNPQHRELPVTYWFGDAQDVYLTEPLPDKVTLVGGRGRGLKLEYDVAVQRKVRHRWFLTLAVTAVVLISIGFIAMVVFWEDPELLPVGGVPFFVGTAMWFGNLIVLGRDVRVPDHLQVEGGRDPQADGLLLRIRETSRHSTGGWDDDLWQGLFAIGRLLNQKQHMSSLTVSRDLYDQIDGLVTELDEMITARENLIEQRQQLGMTTPVPGNATERAAAEAAGELEELQMRPLLRRLGDADTTSKETPK